MKAKDIENICEYIFDEVYDNINLYQKTNKTIDDFIAYFDELQNELTDSVIEMYEDNWEEEFNGGDEW